MEKSSRSLTRFSSPLNSKFIGMITEQGLKKGDRLPSHDEFVQRLGVSRAALRESLTRLEQSGVIKKVHGIGTFVADDLKSVYSSAEVNLSLTEMILAQGMQPGTKWIDVRVVDLQPEMQFCFDDPKEQALLVRRVKTADGLPFAYSISYIDLSIPDLETRPEVYFVSIYQYLHDHCGEFVSDTDTEIEAGVANEEISERLDVPVGSPVLVMQQSHLNKSGKTLIVSTEYFVQARLKLKVRRHRPGHRLINTEGDRMRTVSWKDGKVVLIDQTRIPFEQTYIVTDDLERIATAIYRLEVRGAPAIGVTAAYAMALAARQSPARTAPQLLDDLQKARTRLAATRPTATNLFWALDHMLAFAQKHLETALLTLCRRRCWRKPSAWPMKTWPSTSAWPRSAPS